MVGMVVGAVIGSATTIASLPLVTMAVMFFYWGAVERSRKNWQIKRNVIAALKIATNQESDGIYRINSKSIVWKEFLKNAGEVENGNVCAAEEYAEVLCRLSRRC